MTFEKFEKMCSRCIMILGFIMMLVGFGGAIYCFIRLMISLHN